MVSTPEDVIRMIADCIREQIKDAEVSITDLRGDGQQYAVHVQSQAFNDLPRIEQHKLVYKSLEHKLPENAPALALQTSGTMPGDQ